MLFNIKNTFFNEFIVATGLEFFVLTVKLTLNRPLVLSDLILAKF